MQTHSIKDANKIAQNAFGTLKAKGLIPTPENYELWFVYHAGSNPEINRAIEILENANLDITEEHCQELYQRFLSQKTESERVRKAGDQIQETIKDVNDVVANVKDAAAQYNTTLEGAAGKLGQSAAKEDLEKILGDIVADTKNMIEKNSDLEQKLAKSSMMMQEMQRDLEVARREALTDGLTNLSNRKAFDSELERIAEHAAEEGVSFCLLLMDIDHFKSFNDNYGHQIGDQVLKLVARTLKEGVKGRDVAARYGGEEFALILPETNLTAGMKVGDNLRNAVANKEVVNRNSGESMGRITLSGGVAQYVAGEPLDELIERADAALYTAKNNGRNQIAAAPMPGQQKNTA